MSDLIKDLSELRLSYQKGELREDREIGRASCRERV